MSFRNEIILYILNINMVVNIFVNYNRHLTKMKRCNSASTDFFVNGYKKRSKIWHGFHGFSAMWIFETAFPHSFFIGENRC